MKIGDITLSKAKEECNSRHFWRRGYPFKNCESCLFFKLCEDADAGIWTWDKEELEKEYHKNEKETVTKKITSLLTSKS